MTLIAQISDLHLKPRGLACYRVSETNKLAERAVQALMALDPAPDAVIVTGDIADQGDPREYTVAREILSRLPMPVYLLSGNHDDSAHLKATFPGYPGLDQGPADRIRYASRIGDVRLIALDSSIPGAGHGALGADQCAWLDETLGAEPEVPTLIAVHHPPVLTGIRHMDAINLRDGAALADIVRKHSQVERIICGHDHRGIVASCGGRIVTIAPGVAHQVVLAFDEDAPAQFNFEPPAYYLHHWSAEAGLVTHTAYIEKADGPYPFWAGEGVSWPGY
ncbi:3',5'-cyclic AMP phosphodiesterase CpdA [Breoghania corrubedonensis]|uniref:3',5'-cyclic AMP phosphodiesterase CpdA n=1 Tax=Breoghania corrubedonensis TaxID=665038 RepID=A0A2T5V8N2_9HYPH|nr:phosphodiesterase [Breoghania corrubedonensis]PTW60107.1 3',5'-cyclic AMP phosphodiesterase CpdA [Breoghania corrubedonensis]